MTDMSVITSTGIIAIVRGDHAAQVHTVATALYEGGVRAVEVTMNSPGALDMIAGLAAKWQDRMLIGAGTVLTVEQFDAAVSAGAQFVVMPDTFPPVIERARQRGIEPIPGAYTATEVRTAVRAGARYVKLFPAMPAGPKYLAQLRAPLDGVHFVPTGGIDDANLTDFVRAGAVALGIGSTLVSRRFDGSPTQMDNLRDTAQLLVSLFAQARRT
ncbi:MAG: bifunctional 4-hydroxy-2-oxoglutarate aldolase/2-dehydro-3-deoxy-phosphogluconate aldolase [Chloroflexi bacterium]|nr:bifunctional 4-hydroxy-2-oxoglutarate aldolase/2-dehydro-3-deoxy-phosphogluconate aldolase [Chloroflexota bacterium]